MAHHFYQNKINPEFSFNVPPLRKTITGTRFPSGVIHFRYGFLITKNLQLNGEEPWVTDEQEEIIAQWIKSHASQSRFLNIQEVNPADKSKPCPYCYTRFKDSKALGKHLGECAAALAAAITESPERETVHLGVRGA